MTTQQNVPASPTAPYTPAWALYAYNDIAYLTFNGRLAATAAYHTAREQAKVDAVYARLTGTSPAGPAHTIPATGLPGRSES